MMMKDSLRNVNNGHFIRISTNIFIETTSQILKIDCKYQNTFSIAADEQTSFLTAVRCSMPRSLRNYVSHFSVTITVRSVAPPLPRFQNLTLYTLTLASIRGMKTLSSSTLRVSSTLVNSALVQIFSETNNYLVKTSLKHTTTQPWFKSSLKHTTT